ncbi:Plant cysteine oxidase 2 [Hondaea fermentalgiana]|uniref:Plant cysteine oxidase 2 n=1 Tax=Hondaea fermentalgiana TaxID=2315210 RepID=A0A2R5GIQ8_9STRA|nr:Plant cysteine oxidase 2 [Hondaea fermentalgiana]|eukprot:GBG30777.1 Plant cysteine oxidase 2 [Hondaea fermentalgiana]
MARGAAAVQRLVRTCERTARRELVGRPDLLTPELIEPIARALQDVTKADFGLAEPWHWRHPEDEAAAAAEAKAEADEEDQQKAHDAGASPVKRVAARPNTPNLLASKPAETYYYHITETSRYSIGIFILPPGGRIPMHDHPRMCVLSKVLFGDMNVSSYDWTVPADLDHNRKHGGLADTVDVGATYSEGMTKVLFPHKGNMHEFYTQAKPTSENGGSLGVGVAILDVILPPYDEGSGRDCTYFVRSQVEDDDASTSLGETADHTTAFPSSRVFLEPAEPEDFYVENLN